MQAMIRNPQIQFASADAIAAFQEERLREEVVYLYENSPYYRRMFDGCGMQPGDIRTTDDLRRLPVTTKTDLQLHPGEFVCVPRNRIIDYVTTSGTLGDPVTFALTEEDLARLAYNEAVSFTTAGCTGEDILQLMTTIDRRFMAGLAYFMGARELGCGVIRVGNGIPELQWDTIRRIGPTGCIVVPSFLIKLVGYAQEHGIDYRRSSLRRAICIGEALRDTDFSNNTLGAKITELWPELELFSTYASTEMQTSITECGHHCGGHVPADMLLVELLDEQNNPVPEGQEGEVVITTLGVRGMPLLRFKTGDICIARTGRCACGRTTMRLSSVIGRRGQMIKFKGTTLYPPALYDVLENIPGVNNYIIEVFTGSLGTDQIVLRIGSTRRDEAFEKEIKDTFRSKVRVAPEVVFEQVEYIAKKQMPQMSRKQIKFVDLREQTK
jgi:phenylacetate-CoA ligase